ncbi:MAG TPA: small ribosomal subunit Rsm22 family protein [Verrucomicrobiota bacterium]|nr:small ribosomal subunit Rsm22 family protein [Verrucomicrobiota bacterium]HNT13757.1 small ribosomal subunit Rsm22 family protein [Verrucomicrobiota bacterium]
MSRTSIDWSRLAEMRQVFLQGTPRPADYWRSESDLVAYDATFAQRIGWKWDFVFQELRERGWTPPAGALLDWGCGSGIAIRRFLDHFGTRTPGRLHVWDRSALAMDFALRRVRERHPHLAADASGTSPGSFSGTLLISHVLTELAPPQIEWLTRFATTATCILWVEPGTYAASRMLIGVREQLRSQFKVIAPCPHQERCGLLAAENARHWCHHFASPPAYIFTDGHWTQFARLMGIDLRSLPLSFLVLDRRPPVELPAGAVRLIGHPRCYKGYALLLGCDSTGVGERRLTQRKFPAEFKRLKKGKLDGLCHWQCTGGEVVQLTPL